MQHPSKERLRIKRPVHTHIHTTLHMNGMLSYAMIVYSLSMPTLPPRELVAGMYTHTDQYVRKRGYV